MAINFTISYTFSPGTTISSSQVNTNFSDEAAVWQGLEGLTKSFSNLRVDATPTTSTDVAIKSYVDKLDAYRHPNLQFASTTAVNMETGLTGTSGQAAILFPDGNYRTDSTTTRINLNISQVAALSGTAQSGLRTGTVANNTAYACYAVKVTDSSTNFVMVADTVYPTQANFATLNSNFGTNGWVYLGTIRYGDQSGTANAILVFSQSGSLMHFMNKCVGNAYPARGIRVATTASATSLSYSPVSGTTGATIPTHLLSSNLLFTSSLNPATNINMQVFEVNTSGFMILNVSTGGNGVVASYWYSGITTGGQQLFMRAHNAESDAMDIYLTGWIDPVLGVGANPIL